jgi:hypothetical protein
MTGMDAPSLLACWEFGRLRHPLDRALLMFAAAEPASDPDTLADRPVGQCNAALLRLRRELFGDELKSCVVCPECGEGLEFTLSADSLLAGAGGHQNSMQSLTVTVAGHSIRLPTARDLASISSEPDDSSGARKLLQRLCTGDAVEWSVEVEAQISAALDAADPCMDLALELACPACSHAWRANFDISSFLWEEIDVRARRLLDEVNLLARSYGWSERQILELSETRRRAYMELVLA